MEQIEFFEDEIQQDERVCKRLTMEHRKQIEKLLKTTYLSITEIARQIKRAKNTVIVEVRRNGGRNGYNAKGAQKRSDERWLKKSENLSIRNKEEKISNPYIRLLNMINQQQMQIDILTETIRGIKNR